MSHAQNAVRSSCMPCATFHTKQKRAADMGQHVLSADALDLPPTRRRLM